jgi:hypothetical protein
MSLNFLTIEAEVVEQLGSLESVDPSGTLSCPEGRGAGSWHRCFLTSSLFRAPTSTVSAQVFEQGLCVLEGGEASAELEGAGMDAAALAGVCAAAGALLWCVESRDE